MFAISFKFIQNTPLPKRIFDFNYQAVLIELIYTLKSVHTPIAIKPTPAM